MKDAVILYRAHVLNEAVKREIRQLQAQLQEVDIFVVGYTSQGAVRTEGTFLYGQSQLEALGYTQKYKWTN